MAAMVPNDGRQSSGPLALDEQLRLKYKDGHTFASLLQRHKDAQCKNPRDKVYGLVGLAIDSFGFPMDYSRSVYEIWEDNVNFVTSHGLVSQSDIAKFCSWSRDFLDVKRSRRLTILLRNLTSLPLHLLHPRKRTQRSEFQLQSPGQSYI
jgi:hypothetical protein